jgi:hypothetical protein
MQDPPQVKNFFVRIGEYSVSSFQLKINTCVEVADEKAI